MRRDQGLLAYGKWSAALRFTTQHRTDSTIFLCSVFLTLRQRRTLRGEVRFLGIYWPLKGKNVISGQIMDKDNRPKARRAVPSLRCLKRPRRRTYDENMVYKKIVFCLLFTNPRCFSLAFFFGIFLIMRGFSINISSKQ